jgi:hypothetical protein
MKQHASLTLDQLEVGRIYRFKIQSGPGQPLSGELDLMVATLNPNVARWAFEKSGAYVDSVDAMPVGQSNVLSISRDGARHIKDVTSEYELAT